MKKTKSSKADAFKKPSAPATALFDPAVHAMLVMHTYLGEKAGVDTVNIFDELKMLLRPLDKPSETRDIENMLIGQAHALQAMFTEFSMRAQTFKHLDQFSVFAHLALKTQSQCRKTIATLASIRAPRKAIFIKNSAENQQINVGTQPSVLEKNPKNFSNELLTSTAHANLVKNRKESPSKTDPQLVPVE